MNSKEKKLRIKEKRLGQKKHVLLREHKIKVLLENGWKLDCFSQMDGLGPNPIVPKSLWNFSRGNETGWCDLNKAWKLHTEDLRDISELVFWAEKDEQKRN